MPIEYPDQSYYPSCKVRLIIRFDEFGQSSRLKAKPKTPVKNANGIGKDTPLRVVPDPNPPPGISRLLLDDGTGTSPIFAGSASWNLPPQQQVRSADGLTFDVTVIPKDLDWNQNGIRTPDTVDATFKLSDCPIDPRTVRSCALEVYMGTVTAEEFQKGIEGQHRQASRGALNGGEPLNLLQDNYLDQTGRQRTNLRFQGWVDEWENSWTDGEPEIHLKCRDNTCLLIEQEVPPRLPLDMTKPIHESIALYLSNFPQFAGMTVEYRPSDTPKADIPVMKSALLNTAFRPQLGPTPAKGGGAGANGGSGKHSVWDHLTDICGSIGHIIRVVGTSILVQNVRSFTTSAVTRRPDDPFTGRNLPSGRLDYRRFLYGRNIQEMHIKRTFAKTAPTNVEVRSYHSEQKKVLVARFPELKDRQVLVIPGDAAPEEKWTVIRVSGIKDEKTLKIVAQSVYESRGRNEMQVEIKTRNLASYGGGNLDPDLFDMQPGDTFDLLVNRSDDSTMSEIERALTSLDKNAAFMRTLGFSPEFSAAYAKAYTDANFLNQFRCKSMKMHWGTEDGIDVSLVGVNYLQVRSDKSLPDGQETGTRDPNASKAPTPKLPPKNFPTPSVGPVPPGFIAIGTNADGSLILAKI